MPPAAAPPTAGPSPAGPSPAGPSLAGLSPATPPQSSAARLILGAILVYRYSLSAVLGRQCRFAPTCSEYAADAVRSHGALRGGWLGLKRIGRCHPWGGSGYDPVPPRRPMEPTRGT
ncbi:MAG: membrane protein insertion efficiency factor YidD [Rhodospirillaceae bacterium]|nr:membrane protein insertion efficiency factor YidD [Rhodospirillaceae bacterium]MYB12328.1 membrane protein insertion efficiency factor YidD [Rhodospirillaceae bacterium]MYI47540.1 membrane protein insertion efficiency factor YidD [Rhodospirillaceae bacterium]